MNLFLKAVGIFAIGLVSIPVYAEVLSPGAATDLKLDSLRRDEIREEVKKENHEGLDKEITDIKMRAQSGSQSKYSASFFMDYAGPAINRLHDNVRPMIGGAKNQKPVSMSGNVGLRYRFNTNNSLYAATGFNRADPMHSSERENPTSINTPIIQWNNTRAIKSWQVGQDVNLAFTTLPVDRAIHQLGSVGYSATALNPLGQSRFDGGASIRSYYTFFETTKVSDADLEKQADSVIMISPSIQYRATDKLNVFSSFQLFNFMHRRSNPGLDGFKSETRTQRFGLGYAFTRDLYFSPDVSFEPTQMALNNTTFNLSSRMNF